MSADDQLTRPDDMSTADFDRIERFVTAFNRIDRHLRNLYNADERMSFGRLVEIHLRKTPRWRDADALRAFKAVRNVMIHERDLPYRYLFVPTSSAVEEIERICDRLIHPERMGPKFRRKVVTLQARDSAAQMFRLINEQHGSKFPVYDDKRFVGLVTEFGMTRWFAKRAENGGEPVDLASVSVRSILQEEEDARNVEFLPADAPTDAMLRAFSMNEKLQAVLITENGEWSEPLLGIATWGDALRLL